LYAGLHGIAQGLEQVVRAAELLREDRGLRFVLIGDGPEKKQLQEQAARAQLTNVRFWEARSAKEVPALLASADAILVPLKSYIPGAVPSKLYEAMATQRPVVLVASGEAADIVERNRAGCVLEPGDVTGMAGAIRQLRADASRRAELGRNGRRAAEEHFDRSRIAQRFVEFLEQQREPGAVVTARAQAA
jgi:glycosyltransferase involved in cell wall biosynthesis